MGQEFHVLRCYSCQTFQVQQVKKSKKWSCKMCGEKQSLIKEYGRGTGAECRRHVQKLNSLRGTMVEMESERVWTQWENECEVENNAGEEAESSEQQVCFSPCDEVQVESRWTKYVNLEDNEPRGDEDEEEEVSVYTESMRFRSHGNASRKSRKNFGPKGAFRGETVCEDEDTDTGAGYAQGRGKARPFQPQQHNSIVRSSATVSCSSKRSQFTSTSLSVLGGSSASSPKSTDENTVSGICTGGSTQSSDELTKLHASAPAESFTPSPSDQNSKKTKVKTKNSKWAKFLPSVSDEERKDEEDDHYGEIVSHGSPFTQSPPLPPSATVKNAGCSDKGVSLKSLSDVGNGAWNLLDKLSHCVTGTPSSLSSSPTLTRKPSGAQNPICLQPPPSKKVCPGLSFSTIFHTEEDFDDTF